MRLLVSFLMLLVCAMRTTAQTVDAVVLESSTEVECRDMRNTRISEHRVFRLLNERAGAMAQFAVACSKWNKLTDFRGQVSDATGRVIRKFKKSELHRSDLSLNFADDIYTLSLDYTPPSYPIIIEFSWSTSGSYGNFGFPTFAPMKAYNTRVEHAKYQLTVPVEMDCRYLCRNTSAQVVKTTLDDGRIRYEAHIDSLLAIDGEPYAPSSRLTFPYILWAPGKFEFHGVPGDMSTWQGLGAWNWSLIDGRQELSPELKAQLHSMTDTCSSDRGKVEVIYNFLATTTRYVSIQLGIGGWQPFSAVDVWRNGFGDCKGLTNYMCAMLHEVGVPAKYVSINNGQREIDEDFPSNQFNHVIAQVPLPGDTLWLECTASARIPLGYVHEGIAGNDALLVDEHGGNLVKLPMTEAEQNVSRSSALVSLRPDGSASVSVGLRYESRRYEDLMPLVSLTELQRRDAMLNAVNLSAVTLGRFDFSEHKQSYATPYIDVNMELDAHKLANVTGARMFVPVGLFHKVSVPRALQQRRQPVSIDYGYLDVDTVTVVIPEGFVVEALPQPVREVAALGEFTQTVEICSGDTITVITRHLMRNGIYPAAEYSTLCKLKATAKQAYDRQIVLIRK